MQLFIHSFKMILSEHPDLYSISLFSLQIFSKFLQISLQIFSIHCLRKESFSLLCEATASICILFQSHRFFPLISSCTFLPFSPLANPLLFNYFESLHSKSKQALLFIFCSLSIFFSNIPNTSNTFPNTLPLTPGTQRNVSPSDGGAPPRSLVTITDKFKDPSSVLMSLLFPF